ncbi:MAG: hypothetical protein ACYCOU_24685 [Sulfobacillus sp.]
MRVAVLEDPPLPKSEYHALAATVYLAIALPVNYHPVTVYRRGKRKLAKTPYSTYARLRDAISSLCVGDCPVPDGDRHRPTCRWTFSDIRTADNMK